ncbi:MAG: ABC transporter permease [Pirellulales bacterium]|nr:ABC transporter permease [Pirellulales bacterium]
MMTGPLPLGALWMWATPLWDLGVGTVVAATLIAGIYFAWRVVMPRQAALASELTIGGLGQPLFYLSLIPASLTLIAMPWALNREAGANSGLQWTLTLWTASWTAGLLLGATLLYAVLRLMLPKLHAIAVTTAKEAMSQWMYWILILMGVGMIVLAIWIPYNTFGEDYKMYKDLGLTVIMLLSLFQALWTASISISDEVEGRTTLTVLSKPISRWQFILGKYLGLIAPALFMFFLLGMIFLAGLAYKSGAYDPQEGGVSHLVTEAYVYLQILRTLPGLALGFMEVMVLASLGVAISTRLPMAANLAVCFSIYVLGHMTPLIVESSLGQFEAVEFFSRLIATVLPVLEYFKVDAAIIADRDVPPSYLGLSALYAAMYCAFSLLLSLLLFEDRDLA